MDILTHQFVVLAYGGSRYLAACVESVCKEQNGSEVIIATSTPCEHISRVASAYGIPIHVGERHRGVVADFNFGLSCATADILTLAHQDDVYYPDFADETPPLFQITPTASLCFTGYEEIDDRGNRLPTGRVVSVKNMLLSLAAGLRPL